MPSPSRWRCRQPPELLGIHTNMAGDRSRRCCQGAPVRRPAAGRPLGRREARVGPARLLLQARPGLRPGDGEPPADALRRSRIRRSASPPGCSTTTRAATQLIARVFDGQTEGLTRDDILDNITLYWLTNTAVSSARLYWESKLALLRRQGRHDPGRRERLSRRDLSRRRGAGRSGRIPSSSTTTSSTRAATSRPGSSRSCSAPRCAQSFKSLRQSI